MNESLQRITFCMVNIADLDLASFFASDWVAHCFIKHANLVIFLTLFRFVLQIMYYTTMHGACKSECMCVLLLETGTPVDHYGIIHK